MNHITAAPLKTILTLLLAIVVGASSSSAQSTSRRPTSAETIRQTEAPPQLDRDSVQQTSPDNTIRANPASNIRRDRSLESLSELLELTKSNLLAEEQAESALQNSDSSFKERNEARIESIHERIFLIRKLIDQEKAEPNLQAGDDSTTLPTESAMTDIPSENDDSEIPFQGEAVEASNPLALTDSNPVQTEPEPSQMEFSNQPVDGTTDWGTKIATEPVDSIELASSLFMTGNFEGAKKTCESRLRSEIEPDQEAWLRCMIGCCERIMGDYAGAEASFRDVTSKQLESYPVDYARWNLGYIRQRQEMREQFENVTSAMDTIFKEVEQP